jgi:hypothetical protein
MKAINCFDYARLEYRAAKDVCDAANRVADRKLEAMNAAWDTYKKLWEKKHKRTMTATEYTHKLEDVG